jgi:hypothetical protein
VVSGSISTNEVFFNTSQMSLELELDFAHRPFRFDRQLSVSDLWFPCTVNRIPEEQIQLHLGDADRGARVAMK